MPTEVKGWKAVRARTQKWAAFYENPAEYLQEIARVAVEAAQRDMIAQGLVDTGYILDNLRPNVRAGKRKHTYEATIAGPSTHPGRGPTTARTVTFSRTRKGVVTQRAVTFQAQKSMHWLALSRSWRKHAKGNPQFPNVAVIRAAIKPALDRWKTVIAPKINREAKSLESVPEGRA